MEEGLKWVRWPTLGMHTMPSNEGRGRESGANDIYAGADSGSQQLSGWPLSPGWYATLAVSFISGMLVWIFDPGVPANFHQSLSKFAPAIRPEKWFQVLGVFAWTTVASHFIVIRVQRGLRKAFQLDVSSLSNPIAHRPSTLIGILESVMFPVAFLIGKSEFIGLWLTLKVAIGWKEWSDLGHPGRSRFYLFLIGTALVIGFAFLTYGLVRECCVVESWKPES